MLKIFYAVQATGNGHISRAMQLMPYLQQYGTVDVFLSGSNSHLNPQLPVKHRSKGVSLFYTNQGGLHYGKMLQQFEPMRIWRDAKALPVDQYDLVINDFEAITSLACKLKKVPSIGFGHQASFMSKQAPRPQHTSFMGEVILRSYATADSYIGLHFQQYDSFIFQPIIKQSVLQANATNQGHITVYLSQFSDAFLLTYLKQIPNIHFQVFSKKVTTLQKIQNVTLLPIDNDLFTQSMVQSMGVITGAGFETPAEALYLGKKLLCIPIKGQYEQLCNAAALKEMGVTIIDSISTAFVAQVNHWLNEQTVTRLSLQNDTSSIVQAVIEQGLTIKHRALEEHVLEAEPPLASYQLI